MSDVTQLSDEILNSLIHKGDDKAFQELFNRYWEKLYVAAYKVLGDEIVCEDIVQDIFLDLLERSSGIAISNVKAYLYQAVRFQVAGHIKKLRFIDRRAEIVESYAIGNNVEEQISSEEVQQLLEESFSSLPERCREVFYLSRFEDFSNKEIAHKLGISVLTVETHIKKALKHVRKHLDPALIALFINLLLRE